MKEENVLSSFLAPRPARKDGAVAAKLLLAFALAGCGHYSFTGATIPSHLDTVAIPLVEDNSISPLTGLDERLTQFLIDRFVNQTRLSLEQDEGAADAVLQVSIDRYINAPTSVSGDELATRNRVTITVTVRYLDQVEEQEVLQRTFSGFEEYDLGGGLGAAEEAAAVAALENIASDIFTAATSDW